MKQSTVNILLIILLATFSQSCHIGTTGTWTNNNIDENVRTKLSVLNKKLFQSIMAKDVNTVKQLLSPTLVEKSGHKIDTLVNTMGSDYNTTEYDILDQYYTKNSTTNITNTLISTKGNSNDYIINYLALNEEMYTSLIVTKNLPVNCLILAIYGKYGNNWKINILQIGEYTMLNKTAPDYYQSSLEQYKNGNIVDASDMITTSSILANPAGNYMKYKNNDEMKTLYSKILKEANTTYHFPITVGQVKTHPQIFGESPQFIGEITHQGIYPVIRYKSSVPLADTVTLKAENKEIQQVIGSIFKGVDQNNKYILYQAFNQLPDNTTMPKHYGFVQKL